MRVHVLQHVAFEGIGSIAQWLSERNAEVTFTRFHAAWNLPDIKNIDLLVVMGGPMSVNDEATLPWLIEERKFIREAVRHEVAVLGICLGAQLVANALGARVYPGPHKEIGWFDIEAAGHVDGTFQFPKTATVFHWHGETFDVPEGAVRLAGNGAFRNQAFQTGRNVIGLQFHLEATPESVDSMISNCRHELVEDDFVQSEEIIRRRPQEGYAQGNQLMAGVLSYLTGSVL